MKKVSILIPIYNSEKYVAQTIESAINQTWNNKEIIIVDDGSTDNSLEIAKSYESNIIKVFSQKNKGVCAARNFAFTKAGGEYIQYLDHDDILGLDKIETQMSYIHKNNFDITDIVYCSYVNFLEDIKNILPNTSTHQNMNYYKPLDLFNDMLIARTIILPASYLMHRYLIEKVGGWDESLFNNEDGEFYSRIMTQATSVHYVPDVKVYWRTTPDSLSKQVSNSYLGYKYKAWTMIVNVLLQHNNSEKTRYACSQLLNDFIVEFRPENTEWLQPLEKFMASRNLLFNTEGKDFKHKMLIRLLGWRKTLFFKEFIKNKIQFI
jgi:glycosyltransferase involved in cell wall biosynthesis